MMKKTLSLLLAVLMVVSMAANALASAVQPGETASVRLFVTANPNRAIAATIQLQYDHSVLELIPSGDFQNDRAGLMDLSGISQSTALRAEFLVKADAPHGTYYISAYAVGAVDIDEQAVDGLSLSGASITVGEECSHPSTTKNVYQDEYRKENALYHIHSYYYETVCSVCGKIVESPMGSVKEEHEFDEQGVCVYCQYAEDRPCEHTNKREELKKQSWQSIDENTHELINTYQIICNSCSEIVGTTSDSTVSKHVLDANGKCEMCGYQTSCKHNKGKVKTFAYPRYEQIGSDLQHRKVSVYIVTCAACFEVLDNAYEEPELEAHSFDDSGKCVCGFVDNSRNCKHTDTRETERDRSVVPLSSDQHEIRILYDVYCAKCGIWLRTRSEAIPAAHTYDAQGHCECGQNQQVCPVHGGTHQFDYRHFEEDHPHYQYRYCDCGKKEYIGAYETANGTVQPENECCICHGHQFGKEYESNGAWYHQCGKCGFIESAKEPATNPAPVLPKTDIAQITINVNPSILQNEAPSVTGTATADIHFVRVYLEHYGYPIAGNEYTAVIPVIGGAYSHAFTLSKNLDIDSYAISVYGYASESDAWGNTGLIVSDWRAFEVKPLPNPSISVRMKSSTITESSRPTYTITAKDVNFVRISVEHGGYPLQGGGYTKTIQVTDGSFTDTFYYPTNLKAGKDYYAIAVYGFSSLEEANGNGYLATNYSNFKVQCDQHQYGEVFPEKGSWYQTCKTCGQKKSVAAPNTGAVQDDTPCPVHQVHEYEISYLSSHPHIEVKCKYCGKTATPSETSALPPVIDYSCCDCGYHSWGPPVRVGSKYQQICSQCKKTMDIDTPDESQVILDGVLDMMRQANQQYTYTNAQGASGTNTYWNGVANQATSLLSVGGKYVWLNELLNTFSDPAGSILGAGQSILHSVQGRDDSEEEKIKAMEQIIVNLLSETTVTQSDINQFSNAVETAMDIVQAGVDAGDLVDSAKDLFTADWKSLLSNNFEFDEIGFSQVGLILGFLSSEIKGTISAAEAVSLKADYMKMLLEYDENVKTLNSLIDAARTLGNTELVYAARAVKNELDATYKTQNDGMYAQVMELIRTAEQAHNATAAQSNLGVAGNFALSGVSFISVLSLPATLAKVGLGWSKGYETAKELQTLSVSNSELSILQSLNRLDEDEAYAMAALWSQVQIDGTKTAQEFLKNYENGHNKSVTDFGITNLSQMNTQMNNAVLQYHQYQNSLTSTHSAYQTGTLKSQTLQSSYTGQSNGNLSVRSGPGYDYSAVAHIPQGKTFDIIGSYTSNDGTNATWYKIRYNGLEGYVPASVIVIRIQ